MFKKIIIAILVLSAAMTVEAQDAAAALKAVEDRTSGAIAPKDIQSVMTMTITQGSSVKMRVIRVWSKKNEGKDDYRLMKFISPADVKDIGFLVLAEEAMYIYLPEFHRTRRIASSNTKDSFMGSDFSYQDMGTSGFSKYYDPAIVKEDGATCVLELSRKKGADRSSGRILMTVDKTNSMPLRTESYDNSGRLWKIIEQTPTRVGAYWISTTIKMTDVRKGSSTVLEMTDIRTDQNLGNDIFSERFLVTRER
jgi:outer membrane lipoprotein-sorting protein